MNVNAQIEEYLASHAEPKQAGMRELHARMLEWLPGCRLWYLDGKNEQGKVVSNPNIGYGVRTIAYADGKTKEFYQVGISANTSGISVYILGIEDKTYLVANFGSTIGKASVTGYCIKFKALQDVDLDVLREAVRYGAGQTRVQP